MRILYMEKPTEYGDPSLSGGVTHLTRARMVTGAAYLLRNSISTLPPCSKSHDVFALSPRRLRFSTRAFSSTLPRLLIRAEKNGGHWYLSTPRCEPFFVPDLDIMRTRPSENYRPPSMLFTESHCLNYNQNTTLPLRMQIQPNESYPRKLPPNS